MAGAAELDFAYKYPFSDEAKRVVGEMNLKAVDPKYVKLAEVHLREAVKDGVISYDKTGMESIKKDYLISYLYSRMLASATRDMAVIGRYCKAEARRSAAAMKSGGLDDLLRLASELKINLVRLGKDDPFSMNVFDFLKLSKGERELDLVNQKLAGGLVYIDDKTALDLMAVAVRDSMMAGLPADPKTLPNEIIEHARSVRIQPAASPSDGQPARGTGWVEALLERPILDGRHRIVNLVLAPYLVNVKKLDVDKAVQVIHTYIEKCKTINPATNINEQYIRYQCNYAKNKGLRPMSLRRAREIFGDVV